MKFSNFFTKNIFFNFFRLILLIFFSQTISYAQQLIPSFSKTYSFYYSGVRIGNANVSLNITPSKEYRLEVSATPSGVSTLFFSQNYYEISQGKIEGNHVLPISYKKTLKNSKNGQYSNINFNWQNKKASFDFKSKRGISKKGNLNLIPDIVDQLSLQLLVSMDLKNDIKRRTYSFIDEGQIKIYNVTHLGNEKLKVKKSTYNTYKIEQQSTKANRKTIIWLDVENNYLPVKIKQIKNGKEHFNIEVDGNSVYM